MARDAASRKRQSSFFVFVKGDGWVTALESQRTRRHFHPQPQPSRAPLPQSGQQRILLDRIRVHFRFWNHAYLIHFFRIPAPRRASLRRLEPPSSRSNNSKPRRKAMRALLPAKRDGRFGHRPVPPRSEEHT